LHKCRAWIHFVSIRIVAKPFLRQAAARYPEAGPWLRAFEKIASASKWTNVVDLRAQYPHADAVVAASGRSVVVLNAAGNKYRLIVAIHFNRQVIFALRFLTHAEYSKNAWKREL